MAFHIFIHTFFLEAARDLQLVQIRNTDGTRSETPRSTTSRSSSRSKRRQSPHQSQERNYRAHSHQRQKVYEESTLQNSIYRKFEETETLLDQLRIQEGFGVNHPQVYKSIIIFHSCVYIRT